MNMGEAPNTNIQNPEKLQGPIIRNASIRTSSRRLLRLLIGGSAVVMAVMLTLNGCVTKAAAKAQAREAFVAGQQQAMARMPQNAPTQGPSITVIGPVKNGLIPWTEDLT